MGVLLTKDVLDDIIKRRHKDGQTLSCEKIEGENYSRYYIWEKAKEYYGGWTNALIANGAPVNRKQLDVNQKDKLTKEDVIDELLNLGKSGHSMKIRDFDNLLKYGIRKYFGGYKNAKKELGIVQERDYTNLSRAKTKYTDQDIKQALLKCHVNGYTSKQVYAEIKQMVDVMNRRWGGLNKTCNHFGIPRFERESLVGKGRTWTPERIAKTLREVQEKGLPLSSNYLKENGYRSLVYAVKKYYGTWNEGLTTLGYEIHYETPQYDWTKDRVKEETLKALLDGERPYLSALSKRVRGYSSAVSRYFGSFDAVKEYCGICALSDKPNVVDDTPKTYRPNLSTKDGIKREIIRLDYIGCPLNYNAVDERRSYLLKRTREVFGSWRNAVEYAGIAYNEITVTDNTLSECGSEFEIVLGEILKELGVYFEKYAHDKYDPDFVLSDGYWIDAKLSEWTDVSETVKRYLPECNSLTIVYLQGRKSERYRGRKYKHKSMSVYVLTGKLPKAKEEHYNAKLREIEDKIKASKVGSHSHKETA